MLSFFVSLFLSPNLFCFYCLILHLFLSSFHLSLPLSSSLPSQGFQEQMLQSVGDIRDNTAPLSLAAKGEAEKLGHQVTAVANLFPSLTGAAIGAASRTSGQQMQTNILEKTKTLTEAGLQMVYASKESGGNPKSTESHAKVDQAARFMVDAAAELTELLEKAGAETGLIIGELIVGVVYGQDQSKS